MSPMLQKLLFVLLCVAVPIIWGIAVNWLFRRLNPPSDARNDGTNSQDEAVIEYYI